MHLAEVDIYGFDYDYTLALYSHSLNEMIYNKARAFLIEHFKVRSISCFGVFRMVPFRANLILLTFKSSQYPQGINNFGYLDNFAIRGLHYDIQKVQFCILII